MAADGSGWDSSQYAALAKAGPNKFFSAIREAQIQAWTEAIDANPHLYDYSSEELTDKIAYAMCKTDTVFFTRFHDINGQWDDHIHKIWMRDHSS